MTTTTLTRQQLAQRLRQRTNAHNGWVTRTRTNTTTSCGCNPPNPAPPANATTWLNLCQTVQCATCGRAIYTPDGQPVRNDQHRAVRTVK